MKESTNTVLKIMAWLIVILVILFCALNAVWVMLPEVNVNVGWLVILPFLGYRLGKLIEGKKALETATRLMNWE